MKVLTVDDSSVVRKIIRGAVEVLEYQLLEAEDGYEALDILEKQYVDVKLILLDWNMPGINGFELLKSIKENKKYKKIPVMMVTTESEKENIIQAIQAGACHYLVKPFTMDELTKRMLECVGKGEV